jgi:superfamily I DNA/RNA helicase
MRGECKYDETAKPSSVFISQHPSFNHQTAEILGKISSQLNLYPDEHIGVLFPKKEQVQSFKASLALANIPESTRVWIDTLHGGKGWEFRAVHIGGCESLYKMGPTQKRLAYTGVLRAKTSVNVYYTGKIPGYLESAIASINPPPAEPELSDLFGAK